MVDAKNIPQDIVIITEVKLLHSKRPIDVLSLDLRLPPIDPFLQKQWRSMGLLDPYLKQIFPEFPIITFKKPNTVREYCIRAKLHPPNENKQTSQQLNSRILSFKSSGILSIEA